MMPALHHVDLGAVDPRRLKVLRHRTSCRLVTRRAARPECRTPRPSPVKNRSERRRDRLVTMRLGLAPVELVAKRPELEQIDLVGVARL